MKITQLHQVFCYDDVEAKWGREETEGEVAIASINRRKVGKQLFSTGQRIHGSSI
jgi:hypothetical protein